VLGGTVDMVFLIEIRAREGRRFFYCEKCEGRNINKEK